MRKAKAIHNEASDGDLSMQGSFMASQGWLDKFMKRNGLSLRRRTTVAQKKSKLIGGQAGDGCCTNSKVTTEI